jgi:hypothetical protein
LSSADFLKTGLLYSVEDVLYDPPDDNIHICDSYLRHIFGDYLTKKSMESTFRKCMKDSYSDVVDDDDCKIALPVAFNVCYKKYIDI